MKPITSFVELTTHLKKIDNKRKIVAVCPYDESSQQAISKIIEENIAEFILIGCEEKLINTSLVLSHPESVSVIDCKDTDEAAAQAVALVKNEQADILMKGIINTDNLLRAILNKEQGILPKGKVLSHLTVMEVPNYNKLLFFSDAAVIPYPTFEQRVAMLRYLIETCKSFGITCPRVALIHCTEKVNPKLPQSVEYAQLVAMAKQGEFGDAIIDGPMDVKVACNLESAQVKGINSPIEGQADALLFADIEAGNTFYKAMTTFAGAKVAAILKGPNHPVVLTSRSDAESTKFCSLAISCLTT
jgi:phosphotransacetylase